MQVGGHGIGNKSLFDRRHGISEPEAPRSVTHIENHSTVSRLLQDGIDLPIGQKDRKLLRKNMSMNVSGSGFLENEVRIGPFWTRPKIEHHRNFCCFSAGDGPIHSRPTGMQFVQGFLRPVVSRLYTHDDVRIS